MFEKFNLNFSAVWRKMLIGGIFATLMGYTYKLNQEVDAAIDAKYPKPKDEAKNKNETTS